MFKRLKDNLREISPFGSKLGGRKRMNEFEDHVADSYYLRNDDVSIANSVKATSKMGPIAPIHGDASTDPNNDEFNVRSRPTEAKNEIIIHDKRYNKELIYSAFELRDYTNVDDPSMTKFAYEVSKVLDM